MTLSYFDKVWNDHVIDDLGDGAFLIHIDRHFLHELSGSVALRELDRRGLPIRNPELTFCTLDHLVETLPARTERTRVPGGDAFIAEFADRARARGLRFFGLSDRRQGIVHVIAPELGIALPGTTFICGDSHTCTVGGCGAFAWGVGSSDSEHALATQTLILSRPRTMRVRFEGTLAPHVSAKDMILALIGRYGADGGSGHAIEFAGEAVRRLPMAARMTLCNMSVEFGARTGMIAPDEVTFAYLEGRDYAPKGEDWTRATAYWRSLASAQDACFDAEHRFDCTGLAPQVTWGTSPEHVVDIDGVVPGPDAADTSAARAARARALEYSGLTPGTRLTDLAIAGAFVGSCTNGRIDDLRAAAAVLRGRRVAPGVAAICTPGSAAVKRQAEAEGLDRIFVDAGFAWREPGCSLCISGALGGEGYPEQARVVATTNRNFEHRQGQRVRSHLASPATVAASALLGRIADVRAICGDR